MSTQSNRGIYWAIILAILSTPFVLCTGWIGTGIYLASQRPAAPVAKPQSVSPATAAKQKQRAELIGKLTAQGAFSKVEVRDGGLVRLWTGPQFDALQYDTKKAFVSVVYAYCFDGQDSDAVVVIHDGRTGKQIGRFTKHGLAMN